MAQSSQNIRNALVSSELLRRRYSFYLRDAGAGLLREYI